MGNAGAPGGAGRDAALTTARLDACRHVQALAYAACDDVARQLQQGWSERRAAAALGEALRSRGVQEWFHTPFAWFGRRTAFRPARGAWTPAHFFPTHLRLVPGMPVILDVAPIVDGVTADVGYSCWYGTAPHPAYERLCDDLAVHRELIVDQVRAGRTMAQVARAVDRLATEQGYRSAHRSYPFAVLAHRVATEQAAVPASVRARTVGGFGLGAQRWLGRSLVASLRGRAGTPLWNDSAFADRPPAAGLWAVEPHLALRDLGAKFEELLVVGDGEARWLDDDLPHVRRWRTRTVGAGVVS